MLAFRDKTQISLLFVCEDFHRQDIAKNMLHHALNQLKAANEKISQMTVNSSPYALEIYKKRGFRAISEIQEQNGIIFIPMVRETRKQER